MVKVLVMKGFPMWENAQTKLRFLSDNAFANRI
jgi:hypothetical protein